MSLKRFLGRITGRPQKARISPEEQEQVEEESRRRYLERRKVEEDAEREAERLATQDQARLDIEIEDWTASIDRKDVERWINEDLERQYEIVRKRRQQRIRELPDFSKGITFHNLYHKATFYDPRGRKTGGLSKFKICVTPECLRQSNFEDDSIGYITVDFVNGDKQYRAIHVCENFIHGSYKAEWLKHTELDIILEQREKSGGMLKEIPQYSTMVIEDLAQVAEIVARETGGEYPRWTTNISRWFNMTLVRLRDNPTQSRVADYLERYKEHFEDVVVDHIFFRDIPEEGSLRNYVNKYIADAPGDEKTSQDFVEDILGEFDTVASEYSPIERFSVIVAGADHNGFEINTKGAQVALLDRPDWWELLPDEEDMVEFHRAALNDLYVAQGRLRKMKELYRQVMVQMALIEPVSEPEEAEKGEEVQAPTDRGIEWVRAAFLNKLKSLDVDIGEDFFIFEEREEEGVMLVRGRAYLERPIWGALNDMVRRELGGRYDSSERGWVIEK